MLHHINELRSEQYNWFNNTSVCVGLEVKMIELTEIMDTNNTPSNLKLFSSDERTILRFVVHFKVFFV